jgi:[protein-PII] uridylyltransferase
MQRSLDRIPSDSAGRLGWRQRTGLHSDPPAALCEARSCAATIEVVSPFARCDGSLPPAKLLAGIRSVLEIKRDVIRDDFEVGGNGFAAARRHSELMDALVRHLLDLADRRVATGHEAHGRQLAVAAVGGYGRAELAPNSDIDLLFLTGNERTIQTVQIIEFVLYRLWDLGLRVGHAVRSVDDCINTARSDWRTGISLLDLRFLWGQRPLHDGFTRRFRTEIASNGEGLADALLCDMARRHARFQDLEAPDVKQGPGGLRDLQTLLWLGKIRGEVRQADHAMTLRFLEPADYSNHTAAARFLWCVRCHLHYLSGRAEERLDKNLQPQVARRMLWDERPDLRSASTLLHRFRQATRQIEDLSARFVRH